MHVQAIVDELLYERAPWLQANNIIIRAINQALKAGLGYADSVSQLEALDGLSGSDILKQVGALIAKDCCFQGLDKIPKNGAGIIVANHPTGIADAIILFSEICKIRPDLFFFANNDTLRVFPQLKDQICPVEWKKEKRNLSRTRATLEFTKSAIESKRLGIIFPSGRIAKRKRLSLIEREWMPSAISLARKFEVPIIPIHIFAINSILF